MTIATNQIAERLDKGRVELLDLSTRNRLLSIPKTTRSARIVNIYDEKVDEIYRLLVEEGKSLAFLPGKEKLKETNEKEVEDLDGKNQDEESGVLLPQPEGNDVPGETPTRHADLKLQTKLTSEALQRRLLDMQYDANTLFEEQGVNILYLALGQLKWYDAATSDIERFAPLVLLPVRLERKSTSQKFHITWTEEDPSENISLGEKLKQDFKLSLPEFKHSDDFDPCVYISQVKVAISSQATWEVSSDAMVLGFFSFAKFLMWRDLDHRNWPKENGIHEHNLVSSLLGEGFPENESLISEDAQVDEIIPVPNLVHVVDADSSQALAVESARRSANLVIQGPPGTGKSQTITNILSAAVADGKRVLFVAEKMAALDVVKRRMDSVGLGALCLELHSKKSNKRQVLEEINRTWDLGCPKLVNAESIQERLASLRSDLNGHVSMMHASIGASGYSPFQVIGHLVALETIRLPKSTKPLYKNAELWTRADRELREQIVQELALRLRDIGVPKTHPWRGVGKEAILKLELDRILDLLQSTKERLSKFILAAEGLAQELKVNPPENIQQFELQAAMANHAVAAPMVDRTAISNFVWSAGMQKLQDVIATGRRLAEVRSLLIDRHVSDTAWKTDLEKTRRNLAIHGDSFFKIFSREYREAVKVFKSVMAEPVPKRAAERLLIIDLVIEGQKALRAIEEANAIGESAFGILWLKDKTDWAGASAIASWVDGITKASLPASFLGIFSKVEDLAQLSRHSDNAKRILKEIDPEFTQLVLALELDLTAAFGANAIGEISLTDISSRLQLWLSSSEDIYKWIGYFLRVQRAKTLGLEGFADAIHAGDLSAENIYPAFRRAYFECLLETAAAHDRKLAQFDGAHHSGLVEQFREFDRRRIDLARAEVAHCHFQKMPKGASGVGQLGTLRGEIARKRGHMPLRKLFRSCGEAIQAIKPIFMMSPLSVAQFLEPGAVSFDLLVIDEASQVEPVDALGAIARCRQMVVVGDDKQLPPSRFFSRITSDDADDDESDDGAAKVGDVESVLTLCLAKGVSQKMLRWHYRSRHHSLIAVSNKEFYENRLFIVPSPFTAAAGTGLIFRHVPNGVFDSGGTATNKIEAQEVAKAILNHAANHPDLTLGVATFSIKQRQAIRDELEVLLRLNPQAEGFFAAHPDEPFFIKNLENVQGDERDVILISVGYGKNAQGYMAMRFGPLSSEGGERRLNVLISRAKKRCEVYSSITADDIDTERAKGRGVIALKVFLGFAQTGRLQIAQRTDKEVESPFEDSVKRALEAEGYEIHPQVGIAGFFIDLAVSDSTKPGRYVVGIECDGAAYHSSRSARDRDRLRQAVLEDHGWIIHRIWSADWFAKPQEQLKKTVAKIEAAKVELTQADEFRNTEAKAQVSVETVVRDNASTVTLTVGQVAEPYSEYRFTPPSGLDPHQLAVNGMADIVYRIVEEEGPVHEDEVIVRVRSNWGLQRAGSRIQQAVKTGLTRASKTRPVTKAGKFYDIANRNVRVRDRSNVLSGDLRKPEMIAPAEVEAAIIQCIKDAMGASAEECPVAVGRILGFKSTSAQLKVLVDQCIHAMLQRGFLKKEDELLKLS